MRNLPSLLAIVLAVLGGSCCTPAHGQMQNYVVDDNTGEVKSFDPNEEIQAIAENLVVPEDAPPFQSKCQDRFSICAKEAVMKFGSFLPLNPRLVRKRPSHGTDVCYLAYNDEPEILCQDLPRNRWMFLGVWFLSPERHFWEWICFVSASAMILKYYAGPRLHGQHSCGASSDASRDHLFQPKRWMQLSTLVFYPYVAWTKLHWSNSNYPMRWLLFVGMPVGTLWILSALFTLVVPFAHVSATRRQYLLQLWLSFLPSLFPVIAELLRTVSGIFALGGRDTWDAVYNVMYLSHVLYLSLVPVYYIIYEGRMTMLPPREKSVQPMWYILSIPKEWLQWQIVGNAWACLYYIGIMTPLSIYAGLSVNEMVTPFHFDADTNFRIRNMMQWFIYGLELRGIMCVLELLTKKAKNVLLSRKKVEKQG